MKLVAAAILVTAMVVGLWIFHYKVWRLKHPTAPTWTYWVTNE